MKKFWYDEYSGGFNWALLAVIVFVGIFIFNIITAEVIVPEKADSSGKMEQKEGSRELENSKGTEQEQIMRLPGEENKLNI